jgi:transcriptional regulator with XRE-family HTH domain
MKLDEYLTRSGMTDAVFAEKINRDRSSVSRWRRNVSRPDWTALVAIAKATAGAVSANDFIANDRSPSRPSREKSA